MTEFEPTNRRSIYLNGCTTTKDMSDFEVSLIEEIERLREEVEYWKADSAAAWDKCEEYQLEQIIAAECNNV